MRVVPIQECFDIDETVVVHFKPDSDFLLFSGLGHLEDSFREQHTVASISVVTLHDWNSGSRLGGLLEKCLLCRTGEPRGSLDDRFHKHIFHAWFLQVLDSQPNILRQHVCEV